MTILSVETFGRTNINLVTSNNLFFYVEDAMDLSITYITFAFTLDSPGCS